MATYWLTVFQLGQPGGGHDHAHPRCHRPKPGDGQLTTDDHHHDPRRDLVDLEQRDQGRRHQELVGDGIEEGAQGGDLVAAARDDPVEPVGDGGQDEDGRRDQRVDPGRRDEKDDEERDGDDAGHRQADR